MKLKTIIAALALAAIPMMGFAQEEEKSNAVLSAEYKHEIKALNAEIKALKSRKNLDPTNASIDNEIVQKKAELATARSRKKIVDKAIKAEKAHAKAIKAAQKAKEKAERATATANKMKAGMKK